MTEEAPVSVLPRHEQRAIVRQQQIFRDLA